MKCVLVFLLVFAAAPTLAGPFDAEVTVYPTDTTWTGGVYYIPSWPYWGFWWQNPITWGNFFWMTVPSAERGFARYDVSSIPDGATVTSASVHYYVYWDTLNTPAEIRLLAVEPHPDSEDQAQEVYAAIGAGTRVATVDSTFAGWNEVSLNEDAYRAIEQATMTTEWFGLGWLYPGTDSADAMARGWRSDSLKTHLVVSYEMTGLQEVNPGAQRPRILSAPNPAMSGWTRLEGIAPGTVRLRDVSGRLVSVRQSTEPGGARLDLAGVPSGLYFIDCPGHASIKLGVQRAGR